MHLGDKEHLQSGEEFHSSLLQGKDEVVKYHNGNSILGDEKKEDGSLQEIDQMEESNQDEL